MRELTVHEMGQASGGILPIVGVAVALASIVVRHKVASAFLGGVGLVLAGESLVSWHNDDKMCKAE